MKKTGARGKVEKNTGANPGGHDKKGGGGGGSQTASGKAQLLGRGEPVGGGGGGVGKVTPQKIITGKAKEQNGIKAIGK